MNLRGAITLALTLAMGLAGSVAGEPTVVLGSVEADGKTAPIAWEQAPGVEFSNHQMRLSPAGLQAVSAPLPLKPLRLYYVEATIRRGPGTVQRILVSFSDASGAPQRRTLVWQPLEESRPDWRPLPPDFRSYSQGLILPPGAQSPRLEVTVTKPATPDKEATCELVLSRLVIEEGPAVPFGDRLGPNQLAGGNMEMSVGALPAGWGTWLDPSPALYHHLEATADNGDAHDGRMFFRVDHGCRILIVANSIEAKRGTAWRLSFWARGKGSIRVYTHSLDRHEVQPYRVGDTESIAYPVDSETWVRIDHLWFAESPRLAFAQVVLGFSPKTTLDIDSVEFRQYQ